MVPESSAIARSGYPSLLKSPETIPAAFEPRVGNVFALVAVVCCPVTTTDCVLDELVAYVVVAWNTAFTLVVPGAKVRRSVAVPLLVTHTVPSTALSSQNEAVALQNTTCPEVRGAPARSHCRSQRDYRASRCARRRNSQSGGGAIRSQRRSGKKKDAHDQERRNQRECRKTPEELFTCSVAVYESHDVTSLKSVEVTGLDMRKQTGEGDCLHTNGFMDGAVIQTAHKGIHEAPADRHVYNEPSVKAVCRAFSRSIVLASSMEIGRGGMASCARSQRQVRYLLFSACSSRCL